MTMELDYLVMDPTGNITILVETPVGPEQQPDAAAKLMALEPKAEQVGFLSWEGPSDLSLRMAGGEFCANASMSAAAVYSMRQSVPDGQVTLSVSGTRKPVSVKIHQADSNRWTGTVWMPQPDAIETVLFQNGMELPVVTFPGITHVIAETPLPKQQAEALAMQFCREQNADALGLMFVDLAEQSLTPLVYVPTANTLYWENACGSGTSAVGAWLAWKTGKDVSLSLRQPAGTLSVSAANSGTLELLGSVTCVAQKTCRIEI